MRSATNTVLKAAKLLFLVVLALTMSTASAKQKSKEPKIGVSLYSFIQHPFEKALEMASSTGLQYVEGISFFNMGSAFQNKAFLDLSPTEIESVKLLLKKNKLKMISMYAGVDNEAGWKKAFELGKAFGVEYITCEPKRDDLDLVDSLASVYGIKIAIHQHKKPGPYWKPELVVEAATGHPNIFACGDIGHWVRSELKPEECLAILDKHLLAIHLKDINSAHQDVRLGQGSINFKAVKAQLKKQNFAGTIIVECEFNTENNVEDIKDAVAYYKQVKI
jgi:sugar phosphate isomerase/epimerase